MKYREYELKKTQLTFAETLRIVQDTVDACFNTDENGVDIDFRPECKQVSLQLAFCENYLDMQFGEDFDENFARYMEIDVSDYDTVLHQWYGIVYAVNDKIEFRKQKMLKQNDVVSNYIAELLTAQIEVQKLQKEILEQQKELNKSVSPEEQKEFINRMSSLSDEKFISEIVSLAHKDNIKKKPQDHKKVQKKTSTVSFIENEFKEVKSDGE